MRHAIFALTAGCLGLLVAPSISLAAEECMIGDAAICLSKEPDCHWDADKRGCYPGPAPKQDPCNAHEQEGICNSSSLGCQWSDASNKCESKSK
jgi:hypothetical protein